MSVSGGASPTQYTRLPSDVHAGHKSQGATLTGRTIVHVSSAFCPGLLYVMLSRVTTRDKLHLLQRLTPDMFQPMMVPGTSLDTCC